MKQKRDRYEMHKYWGKKPSGDLKRLLDKYTKDGDTVLDPFAGYGVFSCEAFILNRISIANDLNPIAHFINKQLLETQVDLNLLRRQWKRIEQELRPFVDDWYAVDHRGESVLLTSILRSHDDVPLRGRFVTKGKRAAEEILLENAAVEAFLEKERNYQISDWYPTDELVPNSRISAKAGMTVADLFTKRTLACHSRLYQLIQEHSNKAERNLFMIAFTANLANCSKLVPPIQSRGEMAPGAWMTGFYVGETYIENNVLVYFENRLRKAIKGKEDFLNQLGNSSELNFANVHRTNSFRAMNGDAKNLDLADCSVDYVFTDPPYGDAVPYFEQSAIWNAWLRLKPDLEKEIVISDSKKRQKDVINYERDIDLAFAEIRRVLKSGKHFSLTYHSLNGNEWKAITNACIKNGFELEDFSWLTQKSFTPRQINRAKTVKGDVLVTLRKANHPIRSKILGDLELTNLFRSYLEGLLDEGINETNAIFLRVMKMVFQERLLIGEVDLLTILTTEYKFTEDQTWAVHDAVGI